MASTNILTVPEVAEYLRVHRSTVYRLIKKRQIPSFRVGHDWRFRLDSIDHWRLTQPGHTASYGGRRS
jgi:excisionase family DNA binding protein